MTWKDTFLKVTIGVFVGMVLGGIFGFGAGTITPELFKRIIPWQEVEPVGAATFFGATAGVVLGGGLACFGIILQMITQRNAGRS